MKHNITFNTWNSENNALFIIRNSDRSHIFTCSRML